MKKIFLGLLLTLLSQSLQARYYDPDMGRFASRDPIGYSDGMNLYAGYFAQSFDLDPTGQFQQGGRGAVQRNSRRRNPLQNSTSDISDVTTPIRLIGGFPISLLSGDLSYPDNDPQFSGGGCDFLITINGIGNNWLGGQVLNEFVSNAPRYNHINFDDSTFVHNPTNFFLIGDFIQIIGDELGFINITSIRAANHIEQAARQAEENGCCDYEINVAAHSQGTSVFYRALHLIDDDIRSHIRFVGVGGQRFADESLGLRSYENYANTDDIVPWFGNYNPFRLFGIPRAIIGSDVQWDTSGRSIWGTNHPWNPNYTGPFR